MAFFSLPNPPDGTGGPLNLALVPLFIWLRQLWSQVRAICAGKLDNVTTVTLTANSATTTFNDERLGAASHLSFTPTTANAAAATANLYVSSRGKQTATLTHANNAQTDRIFTVSITG